MSEQANYELQVELWQKHGKTRIYLNGVCTNWQRTEPSMQRAHSRGFNYGFLALDIDANGQVEGWELRDAKHDIERSTFVDVGPNFLLWAEQLIEAQGFTFAPEFEKEVA